MSEITTILTTRGLTNLHWFDSDSTFTFFVGDNLYKCPPFAADFLSPIVATLRRSDPTLSEFTIDLPDPNEIFTRFLALARGDALTVDSATYSHFLSLSTALGNSEAYLSIISQFDGPPDFSNVLERLNFRTEDSASCDIEIEFLASHFHEISAGLLRELTLPQLHDVLTHHSLQLGTEDLLLGYLLERSYEDPAYFALVDCIHFEFLSQAAAKDFAAKAVNFLEFLNGSIWNSICGRFTAVSTGRATHARVDCILRMGAPLRGIIDFLRKEVSNVHDAGIVVVSESSVQSTNPGRNAADLGTGKFFCSRDQEDQWVCYDFQDKRIAPTHYSVGSYFGRGGYNLRTWVIEASDDGEKWVEVAAQKGIDPQNSVMSFAMAIVTECRYIRLRQTDVNEHGNHFLCITSLEFFGTLWMPSKTGAA
jgi:hypothetical protein